MKVKNILILLMLAIGISVIGCTGGESSSDPWLVVPTSERAKEEETSDLTISPAVSMVQSSEGEIDFVISGGKPPYRLTLYNAESGATMNGFHYVAGSNPGIDIVRAYDTVGKHVDAIITVIHISNDQLIIRAIGFPFDTVHPAEQYASGQAAIDVITFQITGGTGPYMFDNVINMSGGYAEPFNQSTGLGRWHPGNAGGVNDIIEVRDQMGQRAKLTISVIYSPLVLVPKYYQSSPYEVLPGDSVNFQARGGDGRYTYYLDGVKYGSINSSTGVYTAPVNFTGTSDVMDHVMVQDSRGTIEGESPNFGSWLRILAMRVTPMDGAMMYGQKRTYTVKGGRPPYTVAVGNVNLLTALPTTVSNSGSTFVATAGSTTGNTTMTITDSNGVVKSISVSVNPPPNIAFSSVSWISFDTSSYYGSFQCIAIAPVVVAPEQMVYFDQSSAPSGMWGKMNVGCRWQDRIKIDINKDGFDDLVVCQSGTDSSPGNKVSFRATNGTFGTYHNYVSLTTSAQAPFSVCVGDFDGDSWQDIAVACAYSNSSNVEVFWNDGANGCWSSTPASSCFPSKTIIATNIYAGGASCPTYVRSHDFNGDGYWDLMVANSAYQDVQIWMSNGSYTGPNPPTGGWARSFGDSNGASTPSVVLPVPSGSGGTSSQPYACGLADLNADGTLDVIVTDANNDNLWAWVRTHVPSAGGGVYFAGVSQAIGTAPSGLQGAGQMALADFDNDGYWDVICVFTGTAYYGNNGGWAIWMNDTANNGGVGSNTITMRIPSNHYNPQTPGSCSYTGPVGAVAADFNLDSYYDWAEANNNTTYYSYPYNYCPSVVFRGNGNGTFRTPIVYNYDSSTYFVNDVQLTEAGGYTYASLPMPDYGVMEGSVGMSHSCCIGLHKNISQ